MALSDENKDRVNGAFNVAKHVLVVGWIPLIIYIGWKNSNPQPSLIKLFTPLA